MSEHAKECPQVVALAIRILLNHLDPVWAAENPNTPEVVRLWLTDTTPTVLEAEGEVVQRGWWCKNDDFPEGEFLPECDHTACAKCQPAEVRVLKGKP